MLLRYGASLKIKNDYRETPLEAAIDHKLKFLKANSYHQHCWNIFCAFPENIIWYINKHEFLNSYLMDQTLSSLHLDPLIHLIIW